MSDQIDAAEWDKATEYIRHLEDERNSLASRLDSLEQERDKLIRAVGEHVTVRSEYASRLDAYRKLEAACREWKPIYESLGNDEPDDPITWALKELDAGKVMCGNLMGDGRRCELAPEHAGMCLSTFVAEN